MNSEMNEQQEIENALKLSNDAVFAGQKNRLTVLGFLIAAIVILMAQQQNFDVIREDAWLLWSGVATILCAAIAAVLQIILDEYQHKFTLRNLLLKEHEKVVNAVSKYLREGSYRGQEKWPLISELETLVANVRRSNQYEMGGIVKDLVIEQLNVVISQRKNMENLPSQPKLWVRARWIDLVIRWLVSISFVLLVLSFLFSIW